MNKRIVSAIALVFIGVFAGIAYDEAQRSNAHEKAVRLANLRTERDAAIAQANADWNHEMAEKIRVEGNPKLADLIEFGPEE